MAEYISEEHWEKVKEKIRRRDRLYKFPVGELSLAEYELYLGLRKELVKADSSYAKRLPTENPHISDLDLVNETYSRIDVKKLFI